MTFVETQVNGDGTSTYTDNVTGNSINYASGDASGANQFASSIGMSTAAPVYVTNPSSPQYGEVSNDQTGSQYWMDSAYTGPQPSDSVKAAMSDANFAYNYAQNALANVQQTITDTNGNPDTDANLAAAAQMTTQQAAAPIVTTNPLPVTATQPAATPGSTGTSTGIDLSGLESALSPYITWVENNMLLVIVGIVAIVILPRLFPAGSGYRSRS